MRAGKAYLASAGTTGVLVAAAILLLVVVGALMAFNGQARLDQPLPVPRVLLSPAEREQAASPAGPARAERGRDGAGSAGGSGASPGGGGSPDDAPGGGGAPVVVQLPDPGVGDAPTGGGDTAAPQGPVSAPASEPEASQSPDPVEGVRDALTETVQDVTTVLPRPSEVLDPAPADPIVLPEPLP